LSAEINNIEIRFFDVGGVRSERRKWVHCFQEVDFLIYFVNIAEYDLFLYEDSTEYRANESLKVFKDIVSSSFFSNTKILVLFTKVDLLEEKLERIPVNNKDIDFFKNFEKKRLEFGKSYFVL